ncbi:nitrate- and nitrite sensing domain-containing protein [Nocardia sp. GCM10030253]|uniref:sensor histidine kinase n=1 Tax=Nocardia sp. GCM10030253 TaxID=3273404 RepID=UPI00363989B2
MRVRRRPELSGGTPEVTPAEVGDEQRVSSSRIVRPRTIRGQLARILTLSLTLVLALLGITIAREIDAFRQSGDTVRAASLTLAVQDVLHEAQRERGLSNGLLGGDTRLRQPVADQRARTDVALGQLDAALAGDPPGAAQVHSAVAQFGALAEIRTQVDTRRTTRQAAFQSYTDGIAALNRLALGLDQASDPQVRHGLQALYALGDAKEHTAKERGFLNGVFAADEFGAGEYVQFLDIRAAKVAGLAAFARDATAAQQALLDAALRSENAVRATESENIAIASSKGPLVQSVDPSTWWSQMTGVIDEQRAVQQAVGDDVRQRAAALRNDAALTLGGYLLAALLAILAEVMLVIASIRAIVRPLGALAAEADEVATRRLPNVIAAWRVSGDTQPDQPPPVRTPRGASIEIAAVADALDRVQSTAFDLASEQALVRRNTTESMANLARRNQNLVRRQLGLISEFEREELDPKALSNLFELDHLATRMRRNAESLLVLVGEASPRRWTEPIALTDVIRAGLSEVDDYRRVVLRRVDDIAVTGAVVSELAHILAELIENGLAFSPPDLEVEIYGRKLPAGYLLAVVDHGVGMPVQQLAEANARLRGEQDFIVAPTRYLGHYVVGRLAQRLGVDVELNVSPVSGIVARLLLPVNILAGEKDRRPAAPGGRTVVGPASATPESIAAATGPQATTAVAIGAASESGTVAAGAAGNGVAVSAMTGSMRGSPASETTGAHANAASRSRSAHSATGSAVTGSAGTRTPEKTGPAHARAGSGSPTPAPAPFTHFLSAPGNSAVNGATRGAPGTNGSVRPEAGASTDLLHASEQSMWRIPETGDTSVQTGEAPEETAVVQRTRNGLVKRNKRTRSADPGGSAPRTASGPPSAPAAERSPGEVRSMLASFRAGHQRGVPDSTRPYVAGSPETDTRATDPAQTSGSATTTAEEIR